MWQHLLTLFGQESNFSAFQTLLCLDRKAISVLFEGAIFCRYTTAPNVLLTIASN